MMMSEAEKIKIEAHARRRKEELLKNAEIAFETVPTQEEMLTGGKPIKPTKPKPGADKKLTQEIDDTLYEAAQQGNIGGG